MAVVNRCAISVAPKQPMLDWTRPFRIPEDQHGTDDEHSLYLIPTYDDAAGAMEHLQQHHEAIFAAELELWCQDRALWPRDRSLERFLEWFTLRFHPLVEDLGGDELQTYPVDTAFEEAVAGALAPADDTAEAA